MDTSSRLRPKQKTVVTVTNLRKAYDEKKALNDVSLNINQGEILAVLGPNGAGKTTLINLLLGRLSADEGCMSLFGFTPGDIKLKRLCGAMLQVANLPDTSTVREHIELFQSYYVSPMPYQQVVQYAGLKDVESRYSKSLSGGQKQRLLFALAICGNPKLLFLDEPTVGMDITARKGLWSAIKALQEQGASIVLTTHYLEEADFLSDRIIMLNHGKIIQEGTAEMIKARVNCQKIEFRGEIILSELSALPSVKSVEQRGQRYELLTQDAIETLRTLLAKPWQVSDLRVTGAALEDAFMQLNTASDKNHNAENR